MDPVKFESFIKDVPDFEHQICPFMTTTQAVPVIGSVNNVVTPQGQPQMAITQVLGWVPCLAGKCQIWDSQFKRCSLVSLPVLTDVLYNITQPARGVPDAKTG